MCIPTKSFSATPCPSEYTGLLSLLGKKRSRKQVKFSEQTFDIVDTRKEVSEDELRSSWYQRTELALFKLEARDYILGAIPAGTVVETRGFERYDMERAQNKQIALACTLLAYRKGMNDDEVASVAQTCSSWARNAAFKLACKDFCEVYHPDLVDLVSDIPSMEEEEVEPSRKRTLQEPSEMDRRVRVRTC